jgi:hypothetical protein
MDIEQSFQTVALRLWFTFGRLPIRVVAGIPTILTEVFRSFSQYLQENVEYREIYYDRFLPQYLPIHNPLSILPLDDT